MPLMISWLESANVADCPFPLNNLPYGVFSTDKFSPRCGVAIGDVIFDIQAAEAAGLMTFSSVAVFDAPSWNSFMALGRQAWASLRAKLITILAQNYDDQAAISEFLVPLDGATLHMPFKVSEYTDFYAGRNHAVNIGTMFRGAENALPPNWLHIPIGYNGRASSVVVSGTAVRRPWGQIKAPTDDKPRFAPSQRFDIELEMGAIVGVASDRPITVQEADANIFGYVLLNDWSARDIQAWEYQPLGPFQAKAAATTISPWIVTAAALEAFRCDTPKREFELLDHLKDCGPMLYDIELAVSLTPEGGAVNTISATNYNQMYYSAAQQLAHHTTSGCPMNVGDLLGSGTISGTEKSQYGSLIEMSWGGKQPLTLSSGETRSFIQDGDTLTLSGAAKGDGYIVGFGLCTGKLLPALADPYKR
ncbi:MAG: fumarylacetoacetase [Rhizobiales bacterium]|nr:fumarylacetoacetase [Hyphomicrobiales bacterium]NRB15957.1 fumarylacetoacetase [Hyphomicrobiales bacterium]